MNQLDKEAEDIQIKYKQKNLYYQPFINHQSLYIFSMDNILKI
jgi:hypothetical protein